MVFILLTRKDPSAVKYDHITFEEAYSKQLKVMDLAALLCAAKINYRF